MTLRILVAAVVGGAIGTLLGWLFGRQGGPRNPMVLAGLWIGLIVGSLLGSAVGGPGRPEPAGPSLAWPQFQQVLAEARTPVLVDFYADWCAPCRQLAPIMEQLKQEWAGRVEFHKVNVDESVDLARQMRIEGIPTLVFFVNGQEVRRVVGAPPKAELEQVLQQVVAGASSGSS